VREGGRIRDKDIKSGYMVGMSVDSGVAEHD
jgi:hypothetical protein